MRHFLIQHIRGDWRHRPPRSERKARIGEREQIDCRRTARGVTRAEQIDAVMDTIDDACLRGDFATAADAIRATRDEPIAIGLSALVVAMPWRGQLRAECREVADSIRRRAPDRYERLLSGLD